MSNINDFVIENGVLEKYNGTDTEVIIPSSVTSIGSDAFYYRSSLTSITIPDSVTSIGYRAFWGCSSLTSITIPDSVTSIGNWAFSDCTSLTSITIPASVTSMGDQAFSGCTSLTSITIPSSVTSIRGYAFSGCTSLTSIEVDENNAYYKSIDGNLYDKAAQALIQYAKGQTAAKFVIPNSVTSIGDYAFSGCTSLTSITMPDSVKSIGEEAFYDCTSLTNITIPNSVTSIERGAFHGCTSLTSITIPNSVTSIGDGVFSGCSSLTSITIPDSVKSIGEKAFSRCTSLTSITIPDSVKGIGEKSFSRCTSLTSITIPDSVKSIGEEAFYDCTSLTSMTIPNSVTSIERGAFHGCTSLTSITIPNSVTSIESVVFSSCASLTSITIPNSVTSIGDYAFSGCTSLTSITMPDSVKSIGGDAFYDCTSLTSITMPNSAMRIGKRAFWGCKSLSSVNVSDNITVDGSNPFEKTSVEYSDSGKVLLCASAQNGEVIVNDGTTCILKDAFSHLFGWYAKSKVIKIVLPDSIRLFDESDLGSGKIDINIPKGYLCQRTKLPADFTVKLLENHWEKKASMEDYAHLYVFQTAKKFNELCEKKLANYPDVAATIFINILKDNPSNANFVKVAEFIFNNKSSVSQEHIDAIYTMAVSSKAKKAYEMLAPHATVTAVATESKTQKKTKSTAETAMHPIEEMCRKEFAVSVIEASIKKANISIKDLKSVYYKNSKEKASEFVVMCAIAPYLDIMKERPKQIGSYKTDYLRVEFCEKADKLVSEFDSESFLATLEKVVHIQDAHSKPQRLLPLCRFGTREQIKEVISYIGKWDEWYRYSSSGRSTIIVARGALMLSDTREAMLYIEKCRLLREYAKLRGTDEETIRDNVLADFGFDADGKITFDLGNTTLEVSMAQDLTLSIYDVAAGKVVKSIPKKGADADKYEKVSAQYNEIKANVKKVVKSRNDMLFEEFLSGKTRSASSWQSSYIKNPILHRVAELIVWKHGRNYFTLSANGVVDANNNPYEIGDSGQIAVAHPMEMKASEVKEWQSYFISRGLKQPFEQIWEPVIDEKTLSANRYKDLPIPFYRFKGQLKHGIEVHDNDFHNDISIRIYGFKTEISRLDWERHSIDVNHRFEIESITPYGKYSRMHNHVIAYLDRCTIYGKIKNDDASVVDQIGGFNVAQIMDFIKFANENNCINVTAVLMAYKDEHFSDVDVMDEFVL